MTTIKNTSIVEQNANMLGGFQVDTSIYVGTGIAGVPSLRVGRDAPVYILEGVQTAVTVNLVAETFNAYSGATFNIRRGTAAGSTSILQIVNATTGGTVVSTSSGVKDITITFNGVTNTWK